MKQFLLCMDVGGTEIKAAPVSSDGKISAPISRFPSNAHMPKDLLLEHLGDIFRRFMNEYPDIQGIRLAFPGPFDYENGISLMKNLDKYEALYGFELKPFISKAAGIAENNIMFCNDVTAFALGESYFGAAVGAQKAMFICIGTGCGSAFCVSGRPVGSEFSGVPENGYVYDSPFLDSCVDDYISKRGIMALTSERLGTALDGKALSLRAKGGDKAAQSCFNVFGERLRDAMLLFLDGFCPDCLCLGGQITKSADMFLAPLDKACKARKIKLCITAETSDRALQGLTVIDKL